MEEIVFQVSLYSPTITLSQTWFVLQGEADKEAPCEQLYTSD